MFRRRSEPDVSATAPGKTCVPIHPEQVEGDGQSLRWVVPPGTLPVRGVVTEAPGAFGDLLRGPDVAVVSVEVDAVIVRLTSGRRWTQLGAQVRTALSEALTEPHAWGAAGVCVEGDDDVLAEVARSAIDGRAGEYVRSHGGTIDLVAVHDGCVDVRLDGACGHCPAAEATIRHRVETSIRATYPGLAQVRQVP